MMHNGALQQSISLNAGTLSGARMVGLHGGGLGWNLESLRYIHSTEIWDAVSLRIICDPLTVK